MGCPPGLRERIPPWLAILSSVAILWHLASVLLAALAAPSGPWPGADGSILATPPQFAFTLHRGVSADYLRLVKLTSNYHFPTNRPDVPSAFFEACLLDERRQTIAVLRFPDAAANPWVRHRQALLAHWLADDQSVAPPRSEVIAAPNQAIPTVPIWESTQPQHLRCRTVPQHLVPRDRPVFRPSELSLLVARSYARFLARAHCAVTVEIIRHTQDPLPPRVLFRADDAMDGPADLVASFGEVSP